LKSSVVTAIAVLVATTSLAAVEVTVSSSCPSQAQVSEALTAVQGGSPATDVQHLLVNRKGDELEIGWVGPSGERTRTRHLRATVGCAELAKIVALLAEVWGREEAQSQRALAPPLSTPEAEPRVKVGSTSHRASPPPKVIAAPNASSLQEAQATEVMGRPAQAALPAPLVEPRRSPLVPVRGAVIDEREPRPARTQAMLWVAAGAAGPPAAALAVGTGFELEVEHLLMVAAELETSVERVTPLSAGRVKWSSLDAAVGAGVGHAFGTQYLSLVATGRAGAVWLRGQGFTQNLATQAWRAGAGLELRWSIFLNEVTGLGLSVGARAWPFRPQPIVQGLGEGDLQPFDATAAVRLVFRP
jgi:hypothetical protein